MNQETSLPHAMWRGFLIGLTSGLGAALGASLLFGALLFVLSKIDFIPFVGEYIKQIVFYIDSHRGH
jgi:Domain of unknown function (DUF5665)